MAEMFQDLNFLKTIVFKYLKILICLFETDFMTLTKELFSLTDLQESGLVLQTYRLINEDPSDSSSNNRVGLMLC